MDSGSAMIDDIQRWLATHGLEKYADAFVENEITPADLPALSEEDLRELGLPMGPRRRLQRALDEAAPAAPTAAPTAAPAEGESAERRQLTVLFCDLVDSTRLSRRLDPEALRDVMRRYQDAVAGAVMRHDGHVAKYLGDGMLVYFGWPHAREDQAAAAVHAALDAVAAVAGLEAEAGVPLAARVGIATEQVVIGDLVGAGGRDAGAVSGETPNLAARLQGAAVPGQVVVGALTRRLLGEAFALEALGTISLKGFDAGVPAWRVQGARHLESRFDSRPDAAAARFVGRRPEQDMLAERWALAEQGEGQIVLLSGEAGMGKSRLVRAFRDGLDVTTRRIALQCSPYHGGTAFYPVVHWLAGAAGFEAGDDPAMRRRKLARVIGDSQRRRGFAELLDLAEAEAPDAVATTPSARKALILAAMTSELRAVAAAGPVLLLVEDAHWIDPTTLELLSQVAPGLADLPVMMAVTHRPEWQAPFAGLSHAAAIGLGRLSRAHGLDIVRDLGGAGIDAEIARRIVERADGVPLFIEELVKSVRESAGGGIPESLQALLLARLDRLGPGAKRVAQIGAVVGREFSHRLLHEGGNDDVQALDEGLKRLADAGLIHPVRAEPEAVFAFKHALVQDAAYDSLLRDDRARLHGQVADRLSAGDGGAEYGASEHLARHLSHAGRHGEAARQWARAGEQARRRSALREATAHFLAGLEAIEHLAPGADRDARELDFRRGLTQPMMMTRGYHAPEVEENLNAALDLAQARGDKADIVKTRWGLFHINESLGRWRLAGKHCDEIWTVSEAIGDSGLMLQARHARWSNLAAIGDFLAARGHAEAGWRGYDHTCHHATSHEFGMHDPGCCAGNFLACCNAHLGELTRVDEAVAANAVLVADLDDPLSRALFHAFGAMTRTVTREYDEVDHHVAKGLAIVEEFDLRPIRAMIMTFEGRCRLAQGDVEGAIHRLQRIVAPVRGGDKPRMFLPMQLLFLAEAELAAGRIAEARAAIADARRFACIEGEKAWWVDILRVDALACLAEDAGAGDVALGRLAEALDFAQPRQLRTPALRTALDLARLLADRGGPPGGAGPAVRRSRRRWRGAGRPGFSRSPASAVRAGLSLIGVRPDPMTPAARGPRHERRRGLATIAAETAPPRRDAFHLGSGLVCCIHLFLIMKAKNKT